MSKEHPDAEVFAMLGSACDAGTETVFGLCSQQWLIYFLDSSSPDLLWLLFFSL